MTLVELRYYFEHKILPLYYFEHTTAFVGEIFEAYREDVESNSNPLFDMISELAENQGIELPYSEEQFKAEIIVLDEDNVMFRICLPEPEEPILCSEIYLVLCIEDFSKKRFFTVELLERKWLRNIYCLCEWEENGFHGNHGIISNKIKKRKEKIIQLFYN